MTLYNGPILGKTSISEDGRSNIHPFTFIGGDLATAIAGTHGIFGELIEGIYEQRGFHGFIDGKLSLDVFDIYDFHPGGLNISLPFYGFVKDQGLCDLEYYGLAKRFDVHIKFSVRFQATFDNAGSKIMNLKILGVED